MQDEAVGSAGSEAVTSSTEEGAGEDEKSWIGGIGEWPVAGGRLLGDFVS